MILLMKLSTLPNKKMENPLPAHRTSPCTFQKKKGSITLEAAMVIPLFFFAVLTFFFMLEVMAVRVRIHAGLDQIGKTIAAQAYEKPVLTSGEVKKKLIATIGENRLDSSILSGGAAGIDCSGSFLSFWDGMITLKAAYKVKLPVPVFGGITVPMKEQIIRKGWTGYQSHGRYEDQGEYVYVTEQGVVYHQDYGCAYLNPSIRRVSGEEVKGLRNESHGKYYPCQGCCKGGDATLVYITDYGERYHESARCSGLKRTIFAIPKKDAVGKGGCSKCVK